MLPPAVVSVGLRRQWFADDLLIESMDLKRRFDPAAMQPANLVKKPDAFADRVVRHTMAIPFNGGVWPDPPQMGKAPKLPLQERPALPRNQR